MDPVVDPRSFWVYAKARQTMRGIHPGLLTLCEVGMMFLPAIPAYLWLWPQVEGVSFLGVQILAYVYVMGGTLCITLRHWNLHEIGFTRKGLGMSLVWGGLIILGRTLIILSVDWALSSPAFNGWRIIGEVIFYFGLVGVVEEGLFRGLIFHALDTWKGTNWAIWGSSLGFVLWHLVGQGPLVGLAMLFYGLIFALIRWRAGGLVGLILVHGLMDFVAAQMLPTTDVVQLGRPEIPHPGELFVGCGLLLAVPLYLWVVHPHLIRRRAHASSPEVV